MSTTCVDLAAIEQLRSLFGADTDKVVQSFNEDVPPLIEQIRGALEQGDRSELYRLAHNLKSSAGYVGAAALSETAARLEHVEQCDLVYGSLLISQLEKEAQLFRCAPLPYTRAAN